MPRRSSSFARKSVVSRRPRPEISWPEASVRVPGGIRRSGLSAIAAPLCKTRTSNRAETRTRSHVACLTETNRRLSMNKLTFALVAALSLATFGCKKKGGRAAAEALAKMEGFSKSMCECKDKACADKVNEEMTKWGTEMAKNAGAAKDEKPDPELAKKTADVMGKYTECMTKLMM